MYDDHLEVTNPGDFHFGITPEKLTKPHESQPWNPIIANVFYRAGIIERWGAGTLNIIDWCAENANPAPTWREQAGSVYVTFLPAVLPDAQRVAGEVEVHHGLESGLESGVESGVESGMAVQIRSYLTEKPLSKSEIAKRLGKVKPTRYLNDLMAKLLRSGQVEYTIPDKPNSRLQKYRLVGKGRAEVEGKKKDE